MCVGGENVLRWAHPWQAGDHLFTSEGGKLCDDSNLRRALKGIARNAGIDERITPHDLRHTAASTMLGRKVQIEIVADILGHSSPEVTARIYAHALRDRKQQTRNVLGDLLGPESADAAG